ncbi:MAG: hypothetical protein E7073_02040 [Bacteroidales bacterium]|nr:hypothetical protein [Bacteroidales bacterium]
MEVEDFKKLLDDFKKVHIPKTEKTFMGICQYPGSRFEEICSRILAFYFDPNEEHGFRDLWFRALNQCVKQEGEYCKPKNISLILEEHTYCAEDSENKRIDIIIEADDTVYAIENKVGAQLYNNLSAYSEHIEKKYVNNYPNKKKIVLTAHSLSPFDKQKASKFGFEEISYKTLFEQVNAILGEYIAGNNVQQLTFMIDFMKTLNNKMNFMENKERAEFFYQHKKDVDNLIYQYEEWKKEILNKQSENISELHRRIIEKTGDNSWWIWSGWDLGIFFNDNTNKRIGIESSYKEDNNNHCALFKIYITTWNAKGAPALECWKPYKDHVMEKYKGCYLDEKNDDNRVYLHVAEIDGDKTDEIINKLSDCYSFLKGLADKVNGEL